MTSDMDGDKPARPKAVDPFVGRDAELDLLVRRLGGDSPGVVLVAGDPGIGKTRLLAELAARLSDEGLRVVRGWAWDELDAPPFWPWTQVARELKSVPRATELADVVLEDPGDTERFELFDATAALLRSAAESRPLAVLLDDLHAADVPSLLLTRFVAEQLVEGRVGVIGTYRPHEAVARPDLYAHLEALTQTATAVHLEGLDVDAVTRLVGDAGRAADVHIVTGGNPLFVEQVVRLTRSGARRPSGPVGGSATDAMRAAVAARIDRLAAGPQRTLLGVATFGRAAGLDELCDLMEAGLEGIRADLDQLEAAGLVRAVGAAAVETVHALVADTALESVDAERSARLHRRAADLIESEDRRGERAHHLLRAGAEHRDDAVQACVQAAEAAAAATAYEDAVKHLQRALDALDAPPVAEGPRADRRRLDLLLELGRAQRHADLVAAADATFERAAALADGLDDAEGRALAALRGGIQYYFATDRDAPFAERCRVALDGLSPGDSPLRTRLLADLATRSGDLPGGDRAMADGAVAMARRVGDPVALGYALIAQQCTALGPETLARRAASAHEVLALARRTGEPTLAVQGRYLLLGALLERGDLRGLDTELATEPDRLDHLADRNRARLGMWFACTRAVFDGRVERAEEIAERCLALSLQHDDPYGLRIYGAQVAVVRWLQGRVLETEPQFEEQRRANPDEPVWPAALAYLWATNDRPDAARGALAEVGDLDGVPDGLHWLLTIVLLAEAAVGVGDDRFVAALRERLLPYADRFVPVNLGAAPWGTVARPLGLSALHLGHIEEGIAHLDRAVDVCARLGARPWLVQAQLDLVEALVRAERAHDPRVGALVAEASATARQIGLTRFTQRAEDLRTLVGGPRRTATESIASDRPSVSVLGGFEVTSADGRAARWKSRKARELLKILVVRRGAPIHREVLMDLLWPDVDPATLGNRLSVALTTVRRALDPDRARPTGDLVSADGESVRLRTDRVDVDVERFLALAAEALRANAADQSDALELLVAASGAHRGAALPDEPYAEWATSLQSEVWTTHLRVVRALADRTVGTGDDLVAVDALRRAVEADPFDELSHRQLVSALERLGAAGRADAERRRLRVAPW